MKPKATPGTQILEYLGLMQYGLSSQARKGEGGVRWWITKGLESESTVFKFWFQADAHFFLCKQIIKIKAQEVIYKNEDNNGLKQGKAPKRLSPGSNNVIKEELAEVIITMTIPISLELPKMEVGFGVLPCPSTSQASPISTSAPV